MANTGFRLLPDDDPRVDMQPSSFTSVDSFITDDRREVNHYFHQEADESILCGIWECAPSKEGIENWSCPGFVDCYGLGRAGGSWFLS